MAYQVTCEGVLAATFYVEEKAYDYLKYALSKPEVTTVQVTLVDEQGNAVQSEAPAEQASVEAPAAPIEIQV